MPKDTYQKCQLIIIKSQLGMMSYKLQCDLNSVHINVLFDSW